MPRWPSGYDSGLNHQSAQGRESSTIVWLKKIYSEFRLPTFICYHHPLPDLWVEQLSSFLQTSVFPSVKWGQKSDFRKIIYVQRFTQHSTHIECSKMLAFMYIFKEILTCIKAIIYAPKTWPGNPDHPPTSRTEDALPLYPGSSLSPVRILVPMETCQILQNTFMDQFWLVPWPWSWLILKLFDSDSELIFFDDLHKNLCWANWLPCFF